MNKELVPYQEALELKELGFDEKGFVKVWWLNSVHYQTKVPFEPHITMNGQDIKFEYPIPEKHPSSGFGALELQVPTFSQAFRWFREKYNILATIYSNASGYLYEWHDAIGGTHRGWSEYEGPNDSGVWDTYEEAELACLTKLIEITEAL